jgi:hypothetical protein
MKRCRSLLPLVLLVASSAQSQVYLYNKGGLTPQAQLYEIQRVVTTSGSGLQVVPVIAGSGKSIPLRKEGVVYQPVAAVSHWLGAHQKSAVVARSSVDASSGQYRIDVRMVDGEFYELFSGEAKLPPGYSLESALVSESFHVFSAVDGRTGGRSVFFKLQPGKRGSKVRQVLVDPNEEVVRVMNEPSGRGFSVLTRKKKLRDLSLYIAIKGRAATGELQVTLQPAAPKWFAFEDVQLGSIQNPTQNAIEFHLFVIQAEAHRRTLSSLKLDPGFELITAGMPKDSWSSGELLVLYSADQDRDVSQRALIHSLKDPLLPEYGPENGLLPSKAKLLPPVIRFSPPSIDCSRIVG